VKNKKCQIQISALDSIDLKEKGRQVLPAGLSFFVKFLAITPYSPEKKAPEIRKTTRKLL